MMRGCRFLLVVLLASTSVRAQVPETVFLEDLTWEEVCDAIQAGKTTIILPTAGTEQNGPHMVLGKHKFILEYTTDRIARALGSALVAPILEYVPEGDHEPATGHMRFPGTISIPNEVFMEVWITRPAASTSGPFG